VAFEHGGDGVLARIGLQVALRDDDEELVPGQRRHQGRIPLARHDQRGGEQAGYLMFRAIDIIAPIDWPVA
jgi:hypothetical protein